MSVKKATAVAPANIAFIKYWGRKDDKLRLPANNSLSMNMSGIETTTTVEFGESEQDTVIIDGHLVKGQEQERVISFIDRVRQEVGVTEPVRVQSKNSFPRSAGLASSASGFAALALATTAALHQELTEQELSSLARLGSGSACRSIPDGFVEWVAGDSHESSYAYSLYPPSYWDIVDVIALTDYSPKDVGSTTGHVAAQESPFYQVRLDHVEDHLKLAKRAFAAKDFPALGEVIEKDSLSMHAVMMTSNPHLYYWNGVTLNILKSLQQWRADNLLAYATIDAGPNVHVICQQQDQDEVIRGLKNIDGVKDVMIATPSLGAHLK